MNNFIKKNINIIVCIFILIQPILDLITGVCLHVLKINFTLGIIIKVAFLLFIMLICVFIFKKKKLLIPYLIVGIYSILYTIGMIIYKDSSLFTEIQNLVKTFFFPLMLISLYSIRDSIRVSKRTLFVTLFTYIILIFIPTILGVGFASYEITKSGTLGFYNSANEISGIISILTPIIFIIFIHEESKVLKITLTLMYLLVILMVGTKTPLLSLGITIGFTCLYLWINSFKKKQYKVILYSFLVLVFGIVLLIIAIPKTNFYKNIEVHLDYLGLDNVTEVFTDKKLVDHFIFSSRLSFLCKKGAIYGRSSTYEKLFGIGYINNNKTTKLIEMDYFDIFYSHGIVGFLIFMGLVVPVIYNILIKDSKYNYERCMLLVSFILVVFLAFFTGHIITAPSVSLISCIIILYLDKRDKKDLLFTAVSMDIGGIEKALVNLVNRIDKNKYNVEIILEDKKGSLLNKINDEVVVRELKVSNNSNVIIRKSINLLRKTIFKIFNYMNYDFSCCYATYSLSGNKLALMASTNNSIYVHSDYRKVYNDTDFYNFFNCRNIYKFRKILFVSNESKNGFIELYKNLKNKCLVFNNFIDTKEIENLSMEEDIPRTKDTLLVFVGRLDDSSKKVSRQIKLVEKIDKLNLWIIGDGPDRKKYESEVKELKLEKRVTFFGKKNNPYPYMNKADYIILTSDYEGFPVTYLEALVLNKSIITTIPTSDDLIDINDYAYVVSKEDNTLVNQVKKILKEKNKNKKVDFESMQISRMKKLEDLFNEVI